MAFVVSALFGAVLGYCSSRAGSYIERKLSEKRGLSAENSPFSNKVITAVSLLFGICIMLSGPTAINALYALILLTIAETAAVMDIKHRIIPNEVILALLIVKSVILVHSVFGVPAEPAAGLLSSLGGFAACFVIFLLPSFFGKTVGAGDIKFAAAAGFCLGIRGALLAVVFMGLIVLLYALLKPRVPFMAVLRKTVPMGPFLALGMMTVCILLQNGMI